MAAHLSSDVFEWHLHVGLSVVIWLSCTVVDEQMFSSSRFSMKKSFRSADGSAADDMLRIGWTS